MLRLPRIFTSRRIIALALTGGLLATAGTAYGFNPFAGESRTVFYACEGNKGSLGDISTSPPACQGRGTLVEFRISDVQDGSITTLKLADGAVTTNKVATDAITSDKIADGAVTAAQVAADAIGTEELQGGSVTSADIQDGTITDDDLGTGSVTPLKLARRAVSTDKLRVNAHKSSIFGWAQTLNLENQFTGDPSGVNLFIPASSEDSHAVFITGQVAVQCNNCLEHGFITWQLYETTDVGREAVGPSYKASLNAGVPNLTASVSYLVERASGGRHNYVLAVHGAPGPGVSYSLMNAVLNAVDLGGRP